MASRKKDWIYLLILISAVIITPMIVLLPGSAEDPHDPWESIIQEKNHLDHTHFYQKPISSPREITESCLKCHPEAARDVMKTRHWTWLGEPVEMPERNQTVAVGKKNLINNFCISVIGNWRTCVSCHAGYGWKDESYDFSDPLNVDCLICHDWTGTYVKGDYGLPPENVDLLAVARQVGYPRRENCGICHNYGGGGMGVKHGDLDATLINPSENVDIHMGKHQLLCIDCHKTENHRIRGKSFSVSITHQNGIACTDCHQSPPHYDRRINTHLPHLACQTCHIPDYARRAPTKVFWDWSKAGNPEREEDPHTYLKIKGEFVYDQKITPEYHWFNLTVDRYLLGDPIDSGGTTHLNRPLGHIGDPNAKIWPFKIHIALQPYDRKYKHLLVPVTSGEGGYWSEFDWPQALRLGSRETGILFSGQYGFTRTLMYWPISHMTPPKNQALSCCDCHTVNGKINTRFNWEALGYEHDPIFSGGRDSNPLNRAEEGRDE
jgi:octaheme c-type cytochrome (tetrathionate reductase family)